MPLYGNPEVAGATGARLNTVYSQLVEHDKTDGAVVETTPGRARVDQCMVDSVLGLVTHFDYDGDRSLQTIVEDVPRRIVGAAVSTCAPTSPIE